MAGNQLRLLLWKNLLVQFRRPKQTACLILIPIAAIGLLVLLQSLAITSDRYRHVPEVVYVPYKIDSLGEHRLNTERHEARLFFNGNRDFKYYVYYTPDNSLTTAVMQGVAEKLDVEVKGT